MFIEISKRRFFLGAVVTAFFILGLVVFSLPVSAATVAPASIATSTTWTVENSPYVVYGTVIQPGAVVTVDPGAVVKFAPGYQVNLTVRGTFLVNGTPEQKVYFTALSDDSVGGDTNTDASATFPSVGDWGSVQFTQGSAGSLNSTVIRFSGMWYPNCFTCYRAGIANTGGTVQLNAVDIASSSQYGVWQSAGSISITGSEIHKVAYGFYGTKGTAYISNTNFHDISTNGVYTSGGEVTLIHNDFINVASSAYISAATTFVHASNSIVGGLLNNGFTFDGTLAADQTLTADVPYIIPGLFVPAGRTLTFNEGAIVKFGVAYITNLAVSGNLIVNGTVENKVYFTSLYDDAVGGDTNADGTGQVPGSGQWGTVAFAAGSSATINSAVFRYGGYFYSSCPSCYQTNVYNNGGTLSFNNVQFTSSSVYGLRQSSGTSTIMSSEFNNQQYGLYINKGAATVASSSFHHNTVAAILNNSASPVVATNNWWGDASGPKVAANPGGLGQSFVGSVLFDPWTGKYTNAAPVLQFFAGDTDGVSTSTIWLPTQPVFTVVYSDINNDPPVNLNVVINNMPHSMRLATNTASFATKTTYIFTPATGTFGKGDYTFYFEGSDGQVTTTLQVEGQKFVVKNRPVILVPGILGTEMKKGSEMLWLNPFSLLWSASDDFMDPLLTDSKGNGVDSSVSIVDVIRNKELVPGVFYDYFDGLIQELNGSGYKENNDLFVFPYDWRLDNSVTSQKLKEKIDAVISQTGSNKIDLVAHSMGGLVAKRYIIDNGVGSVGKLVFVGTPQLGAPKAFKTLLVGDDFGIPFALNTGEMKKLSQNMSSVYQLLPSKKYFQEFGSFFFNNNSQGYDYVAASNYLVNQGANSLLLANADTFHNDGLDNFEAPGVEITNIVGCNTPTVGNIIQRNAFVGGNTNVTDYDLRVVPGDGTVPFVSALAVKADRRFYVSDVDHSKMPSKDGIRQLIARIISDQVDANTLPATIRTDSSNCVMKKGKLISVHSPVELNVYDASGRHVGITADSIIEKDIPGSSYEDIGGDKFIYLPEDAEQRYDVKLDATATGTFSFRVASVVDGRVEQTILYNDVPIVQASKAQLTVSDQSADTVLQFDKYGTGVATSVIASSVLDANKSDDFIPPSTTINLIGTNGNNGWFRSEVVVSLSATDDNSGILSTSYSLDDGTTWQDYVGQFSISHEGTSTVLYKSIDNAGNKESVKEFSVHIDSIPPEAAIGFDPSKKDINIIGTDNFSVVKIYDQGSVVSLVDSVGNTTTLHFNEKDRRKSLKVQLKKIEYNGIELNSLAKNRFGFEWGYDKRSNLERLEQNISVKENFRLEAEFKSRQNVTIISGRDVELGRIKEKLNGLVLFKIQTKKGVLNYNY